MNKINLYESKEDCCGCGACMVVCSKKAIKMELDGYGFIYPRINNEVCISCGACVRVCAFKAPELTRPLKTYAAVCQNETVSKHSSSGGIFASLAYNLLSDNGMVCGAVMDKAEEGFVLEHIITDKIEDFERMKGSKYVQSDIYSSFVDINKCLKSGKMVLVCGTPCQVAALKKYTKNPTNLITLDLVCHGVPSVQMFNDFVKELEHEFHGKVRNFAFRSGKGTSKFCAEFTVTKGNGFRIYSIEEGFLSYYNYFLKSYLYRENCYTCPFAKNERCGDITIGDYWGIQEQHVAEVEKGIIDLSKNWSCVIVNSEKGKSFLERYGTDLQLVSSKLEKVMVNNKQLSAPSEKSETRGRILTMYLDGGYKAVEDNFRKTRFGNLLKFKYHLLKQLLEK